MKRGLGLVLLLVALAAAWWWQASDSDSTSTRLGVLGSEAERLHALEDHARSELAYQRAAEQAEAEGNWGQHFAFRAQRGVCLKMLGRTAEARDELLPALEWARENDNLRIEGLALGNLAKLARLDNDFDGALQRMTELIDVAERGSDLRTVVLSLEQVATVHLARGAAVEALRQLDRALEHNAELSPEDDRRDALLRQMAWARAQLGDDEGAFSLWERAAQAPAGAANQAQHLSMLGMHEAAARLALRAAVGFDEAGELSAGQRDDALALQIDQLLRADLLDEAATRLAEVLQPAGDVLAQAPFRVLEGRLAWQRNDLPRAVNLFGEARNTWLDADPDALAGVAQSAAWLEVLALDDSGRNEQAQVLAEQLPSDLAGTLLRGWLLRDSNDPERLITTELPGLTLGESAEARATFEADHSLQRLRDLSPRPLPSMAWLSLHLHLADGDRLVARNRRDLREKFVARGLALTIKWRMRELAAELLGHWPDSTTLITHEATLDTWLSGELPDDEAVAAVITGPTLSYLALFTKEWPGTCLGLAPGPDLEKRCVAISQALRSGSIQDVASESHRLFRLLFGSRAQQDLAGKRLISFMLPPELAGVPPSLLVTQEPFAGQMPAWLVRERDVRLLVFPPRAASEPVSQRVLRAGEAQFDGATAQLVVPRLLAQFGTGLLNPGAVLERDAGEPHYLRGAALNVGALRSEPEALRWELSAAGAGAGRLGGLLLSPDEHAARIDEQRGLLTWPALAEWSLPRQLVLDRTRFDPLDGGALMAATAATLGGAQSVLLTRWPLSSGVREALLGQDPGAMLQPAYFSQSLRQYLELTQQSGAPESARHPRAWAAWMLFGGEVGQDSR